MKKGTFVLKSSDLVEIELLLSKGNLSDRLVKRCDCLKLLAAGRTQKDLAAIVGFNENTISSWRKKYTAGVLSFEIEFSASSRIALNDRIPTLEVLTKQIDEIVKIRNKNETKINWQFSIKQARVTLNSKYKLVNPNNKITSIIYLTMYLT